ncbi:MAG: Fe-S cluster assembly protein SufD [Bacteroidota bacterium]
MQPPVLSTAPPFVERAVEAYEKAYALRGTNGTPDRVKALRRHAFETFKALGLPGRRSVRAIREAYKYTNVERALRHGYAFPHFTDDTRLVGADLDPFRIPDLDAYTVVVVNGVYIEALSDWDALPDGVTLEGLREAFHDYPDLVAKHYGKHLQIEDDAFAALNTAFDQDGVFVHVPEGVEVEKPIHIISVLDTDDDAVVQTRHLFVVEAQANATIIESQVSTRSGAKTLGNYAVEAYVAEEGSLDHYLIQDEGDAASQIRASQFVQETQSYCSTITVTLASRLVRNNLALLPGAPFCDTHLLGLYVAQGNAQVDNHTTLDHAAEDCESNELYKGILTDKAMGVFNGRVLVRRDSQRINAYQQSAAVLLSDNARNYAKPELEIYADDVKCSHGSATGQLDAEALFYLRARGIGKRQAEALLLQAFAGEVLEEIKVEPLKDYLLDRVETRLHG